MYIRTQGKFPADHDLENLAQLGVNHIDTTPDQPLNEWTTDLLVSMRERCAQYGIELEMTHIIGSGNALNDEVTGAIFLRPSDERDRQIDLVCDVIRMAGAAGLRGLNYNITNLGHLRTERSLGRGGASLSTFAYQELLKKGTQRVSEMGMGFIEADASPLDSEGSGAELPAAGEDAVEEAPTTTNTVTPTPTTEAPTDEAGTLRQADYTRKTQELAEERHQVAAERAQMAEERRIYAESQAAANQPPATDPVQALAA